MTQPASSGSSDLPASVDALSAQLVALFAQAEQQLLTGAASAVERQQGAQLLNTFRALALTATRQVQAQLSRAVDTTIAAATADGDAAARAELAALPPTHRPPNPGTSVGAPDGRHRVPLLTSLPANRRERRAFDLQQRLSATLPRFLRTAEDLYRATIRDAVTPLLDTGDVSTRLAQQTAWRKLTEHGVTGFVDRRGRNWNLASYVEMATRTAIQLAYNDAHLARMTAAGITQFSVPDDGHPCPLCKPWQGKVLSLTGPGPTIEQARAAGLWHPNCRHTLIPYIPGVTRLPRPKAWTDVDQRRYDAVQRLRSLERDVRAAKRAALAAPDPLTRTRANARVRARQTAIREHVARHGLVRRARSREQLDLGHY